METSHDSVNIQIHGFAGASQEAYYGACLDKSGRTRVRLLCSKTRVATIKTITIVKLSAALLLTELVDKVKPVTWTNVSW